MLLLLWLYVALAALVIGCNGSNGTFSRSSGRSAVVADMFKTVCGCIALLSREDPLLLPLMPLMPEAMQTESCR